MVAQQSDSGAPCAAGAMKKGGALPSVLMVRAWRQRAWTRQCAYGRQQSTAEPRVSVLRGHEMKRLCALPSVWMVKCWRQRAVTRRYPDGRSAIQPRSPLLQGRDKGVYACSVLMVKCVGDSELGPDSAPMVDGNRRSGS